VGDFRLVVGGPVTGGAICSVDAFVVLFEALLGSLVSLVLPETVGLVLATRFVWKDAAVDAGRNKETTMVRWSTNEVIFGLICYFISSFERLLLGEGERDQMTIAQLKGLRGRHNV
jgi:hypothetical protein